MSILTELPPPKTSWLDVLAMLSKKEQAEMMETLKDYETAYLKDAWKFVARREQLPPEGEWLIWLIMAGRGWGKTRSGAEWLVEQHKDHKKKVTGIIGATTDDLRRYAIRGPSGVLSVAPKEFKPVYEISNRRLSWPDGSETLLFTSEKPDRIRGPNLQACWCDELASWTYLEECWDNLDYALRESDNPQRVITTTPKPLKVLREIILDPDCVVTGGSTFENTQNLAQKFLERMKRKHDGTAKGRQELYAEMLDEAQGALWKREWIDARRLPADSFNVKTGEVNGEYLKQVVVSVDPPASKTESSDEAGVIGAGLGESGQGYVLKDVSARATPNEWATLAIYLYFELNANKIVAERNNGGEMVTNTIKMVAKELFREGKIPTKEIPVETVWASQGKDARAEPVSGLYEQGRVSHVGSFTSLEDQICTWEPRSAMKSPDRLDALVWAFHELIVIAEEGIEGDISSEIAGITSASRWRM